MEGVRASPFTGIAVCRPEFDTRHLLYSFIDGAGKTWHAYKPEDFADNAKKCVSVCIAHCAVASWVLSLLSFFRTLGIEFRRRAHADW